MASTAFRGSAIDLAGATHFGQYLQLARLSALFHWQWAGLVVGAIGAKVDVEELSFEF